MNDDDDEAARLRFKFVRLEQPYPPAIAEHEQAVAAITGSDPDLVEVIEQHLGYHGRMVSHSKTFFHRRYPTRLVVFNANLLIGGRKVWWGDLDLTADEPKLRRIARRLGQELHVLYEDDGRFRGRDDQPLLDRYVYWTDGRRRQLGPQTAECYEWRHNQIRAKPTLR